MEGGEQTALTMAVNDQNTKIGQFFEQVGQSKIEEDDIDNMAERFQLKET